VEGAGVALLCMAGTVLNTTMTKAVEAAVVDMPAAVPMAATCAVDSSKVKELGRCAAPRLAMVGERVQP